MTEEKQNMLFKKHGLDAGYKNIALSVLGLLKGCFVLVHGGGTQ